MPHTGVDAHDWLPVPVWLLHFSIFIVEIVIVRRRERPWLLLALARVLRRVPHRLLELLQIWPPLVPIDKLAPLLLSDEVFTERAPQQVIDLVLVPHLGLPETGAFLVVFPLKFLRLDLHVEFRVWQG